jgi:hypothetical protein
VPGFTHFIQPMGREIKGRKFGKALRKGSLGEFPTFPQASAVTAVYT